MKTLTLTPTLILYYFSSYSNIFLCRVSLAEVLSSLRFSLEFIHTNRCLMLSEVFLSSVSLFLMFR